MFNVVNTLHPKVVKEVIDYALSQRYTVKEDQQQQESIVINDKWIDELKSMPFFS